MRKYADRCEDKREKVLKNSGIFRQVGFCALIGFYRLPWKSGARLGKERTK
jgi:hypothetical protein